MWLKAVKIIMLRHFLTGAVGQRFSLPVDHGFPRRGRFASMPGHLTGKIIAGSESPGLEECDMWETSRRRLTALAAATAALVLMPGISDVTALPGSIVMREDSAMELPASALLRAEVSEGDVRAEYDSGDTLTLMASEVGSSTLSYALMGVWPVKTVSVSVEPARRLIPGGQSVGIAIETQGVIVVGASDIGKTPSPARLAGIKSGDVIQRVDGEPITGAEGLTEALSGGSQHTLDILRNGKPLSCDVTPARDSRDGCWRLGAWVRDSTAGVGTLTFIDPDSGLFGALGHAISDVDTSVTLPVGEGEVYDNNVVDVTPSRQGKPGELTGDFVFDARAIGTVEHNSGRGIYGHAALKDAVTLYPNGLPAARRSEVHTGTASIITTVDDNGPREYACEVVRLNGDGSDARSMVIRITDPGLLQKTGGIVQGMSGSPIIQDGRLIGAVTHVMINDPAMGYGISIEAMLEESKAIEADDIPRSA